MLIGTYKIVTTNTLCSMQTLLLPHHYNNIRPPSVGTSPNSHFRSGRKVMYMKARHTMHMKALAYIDIFACIITALLPSPTPTAALPTPCIHGMEGAGEGHFDKLFRHSLQLAPHLSRREGRQERRGKSAMLLLFFRKSGKEFVHRDYKT